MKTFWGQYYVHVLASLRTFDEACICYCVCARLRVVAPSTRLVGGRLCRHSTRARDALELQLLHRCFGIHLRTLHVRIGVVAGEERRHRHRRLDFLPRRGARGRVRRLDCHGGRRRRGAGTR